MRKFSLPHDLMHALKNSCFETATGLYNRFPAEGKVASDPSSSQRSDYRFLRPGNTKYALKAPGMNDSCSVDYGTIEGLVTAQLGKSHS